MTGVFIFHDVFEGVNNFAKRLSRPWKFHVRHSSAVNVYQMVSLVARTDPNCCLRNFMACCFQFLLDMFLSYKNANSKVLIKNHLILKTDKFPSYSWIPKIKAVYLFHPFIRIFLSFSARPQSGINFALFSFEYFRVISRELFLRKMKFIKKRVSGKLEKVRIVLNGK